MRRVLGQRRPRVISEKSKWKYEDERLKFWLEYCGGEFTAHQRVLVAHEIQISWDRIVAREIAESGASKEAIAARREVTLKDGQLITLRKQINYTVPHRTPEAKPKVPQLTLEQHLEMLREDGL